MREINSIIVHCSYTYPEMDIGAEEIRRWHVDGNKWVDIGYHYVIRRNGVIEPGRDLSRAGAHTRGHNADSVGICLVGGKARGKAQQCNFTPQQWGALENLVTDLKREYPAALIRGHNDYTASKTCPTFDAKAWGEALQWQP